MKSITAVLLGALLLTGTGMAWADGAVKDLKQDVHQAKNDIKKDAKKVKKKVKKGAKDLKQDIKDAFK